MKINNKILSIPPYISTSWNNVTSLHMKENTLIVKCNDGESITIPDLKPEELENIFKAHGESLEENEKNTPPKNSPFGIFPFSGMPGDTNEADFTLKMGIGAIDNLGSALQHNPSQSNAPDMPEEVLQKIQAFTKMITPIDTNILPKPEPHCNCMHCQIARAIQQSLGGQDFYQPEEIYQEEVPEEELQFQQWDIKQTDEKLYTVVNRLDPEEKYNVFLGNPVGCTCGQDGCEHILSVLKS